MLPAAFKLRPVPGTRDQLRAVRELLRDRRFTEVVNACDAGREGELIFRYVYELAGSRLPIKRLWISSLTDEAIRAGFARLRPGAELDALAGAARCRSEADWLVGMNATRAVTVSSRAAAPRPRARRVRRAAGQRGQSDSPLYSIGRVQTPTLAIVVRRELEIRQFRPRDYWEVRGRLHARGGARRGRREGDRHLGRRAARRQGHPLAPRRARPGGRRRRAVGALAAAGRTAPWSSGCGKSACASRRRCCSISRRCSGRPTAVSACRATATLGGRAGAVRAIQDPHLPAHGLAPPHERPGEGAAQAVRGAGRAAGLRAVRSSRCCETPPARSRRVFDDGKVSDHHAIVPTGKPVRLEELPRDERRIFDLVARRFLGRLSPRRGVRADRRRHPRRCAADTEPRAAAEPRDADAAAGADETLVTALPPPPDRYRARGRVRLVAGWQDVAQLGEPGRVDRKSELGRRWWADAAAARGGTAPRRQARGPDQADAPAAPPHRGDAARRDGVSGTRHRRRRAARRHARLGPGHARDARRDDRDADPADLRGPRREEPGAHGDGHRAHRRASGQEPRLARADGDLGGAAGARRARRGDARRVHGRHLPLRERRRDRDPRRRRRRAGAGSDGAAAQKRRVRRVRNPSRNRPGSGDRSAHPRRRARGPRARARPPEALRSPRRSLARAANRALSWRGIAAGAAPAGARAAPS